MRLWSILLILLTAPVTAYSGAWLREKGKGFSSNTVSVTQNYDISESTFLEYGVRDDLTLGAEVSFSQALMGCNRGPPRYSYAARWADRVGQTFGPLNWASARRGWGMWSRRM